MRFAIACAFALFVACGGSSPATGPSCPATTTGPTQHGNDLRADEHWTADKSPHIVTQSINVYPGVTLTIDPCSTVQLAANASIDFSGSLMAQGTASQRIQFAAKDPQPWSFLRFRSPAVSRLANVTVSGGGGGGAYHGASVIVWGDGSDPAQEVLQVTSVRVDHSAGVGVLLDTGGAFVAGSSDLTVTQSGNATDPFPMKVGLRGAWSIPAGSYTGNVVDELWIDQGGYEVVSSALHDRGVPYRMNETHSGQFALYARSGQPAPVLTIDPGVTMRFAAANGMLIGASTALSASIIANGTAQKPIVFTSAAASPAPGDWAGIKFQGTTTPGNSMQYVTVDYAGGSCSCMGASCTPATGGDDSAAIVFYGWQPPSAFITNSIIAHSATTGVDRGWTSDTLVPDFLPTNQFNNIALCRQTAPRPTTGSCPANACQ